MDIINLRILIHSTCNHRYQLKQQSNRCFLFWPKFEFGYYCSTVTMWSLLDIVICMYVVLDRYRRRRSL